ncbi:unnamed protein product [Boreogadus saida]
MEREMREDWLLRGDEGGMIQSTKDKDKANANTSVAKRQLAFITTQCRLAASSEKCILSAVLAVPTPPPPNTPTSSTLGGCRGYQELLKTTICQNANYVTPIAINTTIITTITTITTGRGGSPSVRDAHVVVLWIHSPRLPPASPLFTGNTCATPYARHPPSPSPVETRMCVSQHPLLHSPVPLYIGAFAPAESVLIKAPDERLSSMRGCWLQRGCLPQSGCLQPVDQHPGQLLTVEAAAQLKHISIITGHRAGESSCSQLD